MIYTIKSHIDRLCEQSKAPESDDEFEAWVGLDGVFDLLLSDIGQNEIVVYAGLGGTTFMHAVAVPSSSVDGAEVDDLCSWNFNAFNGWGISQTFSDPPIISIEAPFSRE